MYYIVKSKSKLFNQLQELSKNMKSANNAAFKLAKEMGFSEIHTEFDSLAGGISAVCANKKPDGYCYAFGSKHNKAFFPKKINANKEILKKIAELPVIKNDVLNKIIKYDGFNTKKDAAAGRNGGRRISLRPGISFDKNCVLIEIPDYIKYQPVDGMQEILASKFKTLWDKK